MKITKKQLKQIIKEELETTLKEGHWSSRGRESAGYRDIPQSVTGVRGPISLTDFSLEPQKYIQAKAEEDAAMGSPDRDYETELYGVEDQIQRADLARMYRDAYKAARNR